MCHELFKVEVGLLLDRAGVRGVEPTSDAVGRAWQHAVLWWWIGGGAAGAPGN